MFVGELHRYTHAATRSARRSVPPVFVRRRASAGQEAHFSFHEAGAVSGTAITALETSASGQTRSRRCPSHRATGIVPVADNGLTRTPATSARCLRSDAGVCRLTRRRCGRSDSGEAIARLGWP